MTTTTSAAVGIHVQSPDANRVILTLTSAYVSHQRESGDEQGK
jgi:hypothetical protein